MRRAVLTFLQKRRVVQGGAAQKAIAPRFLRYSIAGCVQIVYMKKRRNLDNSAKNRKNLRNLDKYAIISVLLLCFRRTSAIL